MHSSLALKLRHLRRGRRPRPRLRPLFIAWLLIAPLLGWLLATLVRHSASLLGAYLAALPIYAYHTLETLRVLRLLAKPKPVRAPVPEDILDEYRRIREKLGLREAKLVWSPHTDKDRKTIYFVPAPILSVVKRSIILYEKQWTNASGQDRDYALTWAAIEAGASAKLEPADIRLWRAMFCVVLCMFGALGLAVFLWACFAMLMMGPFITLYLTVRSRRFAGVAARETGHEFQNKIFTLFDPSRREYRTDGLGEPHQGVLKYLAGTDEEASRRYWRKEVIPRLASLLVLITLFVGAGLLEDRGFNTALDLAVGALLSFPIAVGLARKWWAIKTLRTRKAAIVEQRKGARSAKPEPAEHAVPPP